MNNKHNRKTVTWEMISKNNSFLGIDYKTPMQERELTRQYYRDQYYETKDRCYVAVDFETMTKDPLSACAIALVKIEKGEITDKYYSLICPPPCVNDLDKEEFRYLHGISYKDCKKAPSFDKIYDDVMDFIGDAVLITHNKKFDLDVFMKLCMFYEKNLNDYFYLLDDRNAVCTYALTGCSLDMAADALEIPELNHHDAMSDAIAAAEIFISLLYQPFPWDDDTIKEKRPVYKELKKMKELDAKKKLVYLKYKERYIALKIKEIQRLRKRKRNTAVLLGMILGGFSLYKLWDVYRKR